MYDKNVVTIYEDDNFSIHIEQVEGLLFAHCDVFEASKSVLKLIREKFFIMLDAIVEAGHDLLFIQTPNERFVKFLKVPYEVIEEVEVGGQNMKVIVCPLQS